MEIKLGTPKHGWVDIRISNEYFCLFDTISDVPCDFISEMTSGFGNLLANGGQQQFILGLEPNYYEIDVAKKERALLLKIKKVFEYPESKKPELLYEMSSSADKIVLPFYIAISNFYNNRKGKNDWHWPECNSNELAHLTKAINDMKIT